VWDAYNGTGTETGTSGVPPGWLSNRYWSATPTNSQQHATVGSPNGYVYNDNNYDDVLNIVALQVMFPDTLNNVPAANSETAIVQIVPGAAPNALASVLPHVFGDASALPVPNTLPAAGGGHWVQSASVVTGFAHGDAPRGNDTLIGGQGNGVLVGDDPVVVNTSHTLSVGLADDFGRFVKGIDAAAADQIADAALELMLLDPHAGPVSIGNDVIIGGAGDDLVWGDSLALVSSTITRGAGISNRDYSRAKDAARDALDVVRGPGSDKRDGGPGSNRTVDYAAFMAGTAPGMPTPPASMLDGLLVKRRDASPIAESSKAAKTSALKMTSIDWTRAPALSGAWGIANPFQRKQGMAEFAQLADPKESGRHSRAQFDLDLKESMPGWKILA